MLTRGSPASLPALVGAGIGNPPLLAAPWSLSGFVLLAAPALFLAAVLGLVEHPLLAWLSTWGSTIVFVLGTALCIGRARRVRFERRVWAWFGAACACWAAANLY
ncbi:MAG: hypothetical protein NVSMB51_16710 [Solirubrobacteraceae bacterium]